MASSNFNIRLLEFVKWLPPYIELKRNGESWIVAQRNQVEYAFHSVAGNLFRFGVTITIPEGKWFTWLDLKWDEVRQMARVVGSPLPGLELHKRGTIALNVEGVKAMDSQQRRQA